MFRCMRTTIRLDAALLAVAAAKRHAAATGRTLTAVIEDALRRELTRGLEAPQARPQLPISDARGGGIQPGVDLDDSAALLDLMEGR